MAEKSLPHYLFTHNLFTLPVWLATGYGRITVPALAPRSSDEATCRPVVMSKRVS